MAKPPRARTQRRELARQLERIDAKLDRAAAALPGGAAERPIPVATAASVEGRARAEPCPRCGGDMDLTGEGAEVRGGRELRRVDVTCRRCHGHRSMWFAIGPGPVS
jgi:hypothetical protein